MILRFFLIASMFLFASCSVPERDSPFDPKGINYQGGESPYVSSSSSSPSSSSKEIFYGSPVTYQGETYETVVIGTQTWMARNLNYNASGSLCYDVSTANCAKYGRLYDWKTAKTACPTGWHLPSDEDWTMLIAFTKGISTAGTKLKATSGWYESETESGNGTDDFGFAALPGGSRYNGSYFGNVTFYGYWWSATEVNPYNAYSWSMSYDSKALFEYDEGYNKASNWFSVRCVMD